nr:hypothetical protein [Tanacetum cinerariifolium]
MRFIIRSCGVQE